MKKIMSFIVSLLFLSLFYNSAFAAGDAENIKLLSGFKKTGGGAGEVIPQDTKFVDNIRKNILPNIRMPAGFKIELFAVAPDARHMAVSRNKGTVWIGTRKDKVWQATDRDMDDIADTVEKLISQELEADVITHVDPVTVKGEEISIVKSIVELNQKAFNLKDAIQDLRIVKNNQIESILFQVPVPVEFNQKDEFKEKCSLELIQKYPNSEIMIEFKSQMSMRQV